MLTARDGRWLRLCVTAAGEFATCGKRQYACFILDNHGHLTGFGYNGGPKGSVHCKDGGCPRFAEGSANGSSYDNCIAIHAEQNALLHSDYVGRRDGGTLYVNGPPCFTCAKLIANAGLTRVVHFNDPGYADHGRVAAFLEQARVQLIGVDPADVL